MQRISSSSPNQAQANLSAQAAFNVRDLQTTGPSQGYSLHGDPQSKPLQLRTELFEHGLFPMQSKLSANVLVNTFTNLNLLSSIDYKIKLVNWVD